MLPKLRTSPARKRKRRSHHNIAGRSPNVATVSKTALKDALVFK
ncbi:MAG TPA: 50S ribosomal protein L32 [Phycisphaerales bacterium]|nr:50S ribosomal protein L32 [Phycisphaerales bacterium]